jgi:transposase
MPLVNYAFFGFLSRSKAVRGQGVNCIHASKTDNHGDVKHTNPNIHQIFVGIDIGYRTHVACACPGALFNTKRYRDGWRRAKTLHFSSDTAGFRELQRYLDKFSPNPADFLMLCEPTGGHYGLALQTYLLQKNYTVLQVENSAVAEYREKIYGSDTKTDDMDARLMARMGFLHEFVGEGFSIQPVSLLSPDTAIMRVMVRDHMKLSKDIRRLRSQLHQMVAVTFPELKTFFTDAVTGHAARNLLKRYPTPQELKEAAVTEIAQVLAESKAFNHAKRADQLLALAQSSAGLRIESHHRWRQEWILNQLDILEKA